MAWDSTADIVEAIAARIAALQPTSQINEDDVFRVRTRESFELQSGVRTVEVTATPGIRAPGVMASAREWRTTLTVRQLDVTQPPEYGARTSDMRQLADAELLLADLYAWAATTAGIRSIVPAEGTMSVDGDQVLVATRTIELRYLRSA
jgi:hypothetical protein